MRKRQFMFRLFYSTTFTVILVIEVLLLLISPGDIIYQSFAADRTLSIVAVAIVYVAVLLIASFIIATRFYTAHAQLTAIPKDHVPIRKNELSKSVYNIISLELGRSASVAYHARPREIHQKDIERLAEETARTKAKTITWSLEHSKSWKDIHHVGWSSPCRTELGNLQFEPILIEFPHLIEAKAVSMAPADPLMMQGSDHHGTVVADLAAVEFLQRPASMPLRQYLERLAELDMLVMNKTVNTFLKDYERIRFVAQPISDKDFQHLLNDFTKVMNSLETSTIQAFDRFRERSNSISTGSLRSVIRHRSSSTSFGRDITASGMLPSRPSAISTDTEMPTPFSRSMTPFMTPRAQMYQSSLSSGHAGDRSSDSELDNEDSAYTRLGRQTRTTNTSRYASAATSIPRVNETTRRASLDSQDVMVSDTGSVVHRTMGSMANQRSGSFPSSPSQTSVIHREDLASAILPLPLVPHRGLEEPPEFGQRSQN